MGDSVYQELLAAVLGYQTGTVNIRRILAPLFDPATGVDETVKFYAEGDADTEYNQERILLGVANACLSLPDHPGTAPAADDPVAPFEPVEIAPAV